MVAKLAVEALAEEVYGVIVLDPDLDSFLGLANEGFRHPASDRIVVEFEKLEMYVVLRVLYIREHVVEHREEFGVQLHGIACETD